MIADRVVEAYGKRWMVVQVVAKTDGENVLALAIELTHDENGKPSSKIPAPVQLIVCEVPK